jgi:hypothetical protein
MEEKFGSISKSADPGPSTTKTGAVMGEESRLDVS